MNRPKLNFHDLGIKTGAEIVFKKDSNIHATVASKITIWLNEDELHLSPATRKVLGKPEGYQVDGKYFWKYRGQLLADMYDKKYPRR